MANLSRQIGQLSRAALAAASLLLCGLATMRAETPQPASSCESSLQSHYTAAQGLQSSQDIYQASHEFQLFIAQALDCIAVDRAEIGEYPAAVPLFERALTLAPNNREFRLDYAAAAAATKDFVSTRRLAQQALDSSPGNCNDASCARAYLLLGDALLGTGDIKGAKDRFEKAVEIEPTFEHGYALAKAYLALDDKKSGAAIFAEMLASYGDSASIHMDFGRAYGQADFPEEAIKEFNQVLARDSSFPEAHYCLGASYLLRSGDTDFPQAEAEFHKELALHPDDYFSLSQLGYIAKNKGNLQEAEEDLRRAAILNPQNPDNFLLLAQVYTDLNRPADAEVALRSAIAVTTDPSRNHYQIRGAHYQLGRLLLQRGDTVDGKREMQITQDLLLQNRMLDEVNLTGKPLAGYQFPTAPATAIADSAAKAAESDFEHRVSPAIADSYNNLGGVAAQDENYKEAMEDFAESAAWNPAAEEIDFNWGKAAYSAHDYPKAARSLARYLRAHPNASGVREPLAMSMFLTGDYAGTLEVLAPIEYAVDASPVLAYAYAESLTRAGNRAAGIQRLHNLEQDKPAVGIYPLAIGRALATAGNFAEAEPELRKAVQLRPLNAEAQFQLAVTLFALGKDSEAQPLLAQLTGVASPETSQDADVFHRIGKLQLAHGIAKLAIANLETAARLNPDSPGISEDLIAAYVQDQRPADAQLEREHLEKLRARANSRSSPETGE
jgi:tetratricopeptide (TPR) repeat protein